MDQSGDGKHEGSSNDKELDLTNYHLHNEAFKEVFIGENLTSIDLTANRLTDLDERIIRLPGLKKLSLRQNLLTSAAAIKDLASAEKLEHLILHDNQLEELPPLAPLVSLTQLEVSYNQIRSVANLTDLKSASLQELYAASNKITQIQAFENLTDLRLLELGCNRIREMEGLSSLQRLEELWLGRNRISSIRGLISLTSLRRLSLQSNRLECMRGVGECPSLKELYLSHNGITQIEDLEKVTGLEILDVSSNQVSFVQGLGSLTRLKDLWLNDNSIHSLDSLEQALGSQRDSLACIYLAGNPAVAKLADEYAPLLKRILPNIEQIDSDILA